MLTLAGTGPDAGAGLAARMLGLEFLPHLEEGNFWIRATMPTSISLEAGNDYVNRIRAVIGVIPRCRPSSPSTAVPTTAPTRPAFSTRNFSCR